jgi:hypothetical protein
LFVPFDLTPARKRAALSPIGESNPSRAGWKFPVDGRFILKQRDEGQNDRGAGDRFQRFNGSGFRKKVQRERDPEYPDRRVCNNRRVKYFTEMIIVDTMKIVPVTLLFLQCQCLMYEHFHDKASDIKNDSYELSLPGPYDPNVDQIKLTGAFAGLVEYKNNTYFDVLVDSLLKNRYFSYPHILIPAGKNNKPLMTNTRDYSKELIMQNKPARSPRILTL